MSHERPYFEITSVLILLILDLGPITVLNASIRFLTRILQHLIGFLSRPLRI